MKPTLDLTVVIPTRERMPSLTRTLRSLDNQSVRPAEVIVVDASENVVTNEMQGTVSIAASEAGAGAQRNQGTERAVSEFILYLDDDIEFCHENTLSTLFSSLSMDHTLGGVVPIIDNEPFASPGPVVRFFYRLLHGNHVGRWSGRVIGPGITTRHAAEEGDTILVDWLYGGCVMYRRSALPAPAFDPYFRGYSLGEDLALSLIVGTKYRLGCVGSARIIHHRERSDWNVDIQDLNRQSIRNRYYIMKHILRKGKPIDKVAFALWQFFDLIGQSITQISHLTPALKGKLDGLRQITANEE